MEHALTEMARRLDALDEASLMMLWDKYADIVAHFEPSKRWEEATVILGLIQTKHWKNQLFNIRFSASLKPDPPVVDIRVPLFSVEKKAARNAVSRKNGKPKKPIDTGDGGTPKSDKAQLLTFKKRID